MKPASSHKVLDEEEDKNAQETMQGYKCSNLSRSLSIVHAPKDCNANKNSFSPCPLKLVLQSNHSNPAIKRQ